MEEFLATMTDKKLNEKLETILKISGVTKENTFISLVTHLLKVSQYLVKNKGIFLIGENGTGKSYIYTEFFKELFPKYSGSMITPALLIGDGRATPNDTECIFDEKAVLIEEICDDDESSQSSIGILKDTLESGYFKNARKRIRKLIYLLYLQVMTIINLIIYLTLFLVRILFLKDTEIKDS